MGDISWGKAGPCTYDMIYDQNSPENDNLEPYASLARESAAGVPTFSEMQVRRRPLLVELGAEGAGVPHALRLV